MQFNLNVFPGISTIESKLKMPIVQLPLRSCLIKVNTGLILHSPLPHLEGVKDEICELGVVTDIVAPNLYHNLGLLDAIKMFPEAKIWAPKGLEKKINLTGKLLHNIGDNWPYADHIQPFYLSGQPRMNESVLIHKLTATLICADLCFNLRNCHGLMEWLLYKSFDTHNKFAVSRLFLKMVKDSKAFHASLSALMMQEFSNIIMAHGEVLTGEAHSILTAALKERDLVF